MKFKIIYGLDKTYYTEAAIEIIEAEDIVAANKIAKDHASKCGYNIEKILQLG